MIRELKYKQVLLINNQSYVVVYLLQLGSDLAYSRLMTQENLHLGSRSFPACTIDSSIASIPPSSLFISWDHTTNSQSDSYLESKEGDEYNVLPCKITNFALNETYVYEPCNNHQWLIFTFRKKYNVANLHKRFSKIVFKQAASGLCWNTAIQPSLTLQRKTK